MTELSDRLYTRPGLRYGLREMSWSQPCQWCDHGAGDHSLVLPGAPCLDCDCPGFHA